MADWEGTLAELARARGPALMRYAYLLTGDLHEAEELVQDTIVHVFCGRGRRAEPEAAEAYVRAAMLNRVIDGGRRQQRWRRLVPRLATAPELASPEDAVPDGASTRKAIRALSPRQRACVVLRFYEDQTVPAIADRLGLSEGAVKRHLSDATRRLALLLGPLAYGDDAEGVLHGNQA
ncbi:RNA polymerase sigma factor [Yinghuangia soli]|uniref:Sigma-70 family RNA polymerase sigma factor n=1 Tax=Yinghuangia soli TaxID=2908204 RepID=A0AA41U435_9ACTN|nr:sigma-70 family RNA polymerase sigma factor [Yinghuangia soli]MCF2533368.1 sigma-70 family RNA polymerase sigma factor [Yinghuangia soli]